MARPKGFEPLTPRFVVWCSIQLSYGRVGRGLTACRRGMQEGAGRSLGRGLEFEVRNATLAARRADWSRPGAAAKQAAGRAKWGLSGFRAILMGLAFALMWSSAFTSARMIVLDAPPLLALSLRFLLSGLIGVGIALALGQSWRLTPAQWRATIIFGLCQNALYLGLNFIAMQWIEASVAAIIASTLPLLVAAAGWVIPGRPAAAGGGGRALRRVRGRHPDHGRALGRRHRPAGRRALRARGAGADGGHAGAARASSGGNVMMVVGLQMLVGAAILIGPALLLEDARGELDAAAGAGLRLHHAGAGAGRDLGLVPLVQRIGAVRGATFHFLNPFFGVAIAALLLGEALGPMDLVGVAIIMGGILAVQLSKAPPLPPSPEVSTVVGAGPATTPSDRAARSRSSSRRDP
jgi:drug/metabolite transporter (DMT)-like permease